MRRDNSEHYSDSTRKQWHVCTRLSKHTGICRQSTARHFPPDPHMSSGFVPEGQCVTARFSDYPRQMLRTVGRFGKRCSCDITQTLRKYIFPLKNANATAADTFVDSQLSMRLIPGS
jgi:hypothetical protein